MPPQRKREGRENQFYDVGVQGRKTGITLPDKGLRDEHGLEPMSGIFSSPQKSPAKRGTSSRTGGTVTESESMEIQESSIPELATSAHITRTSRTPVPPPKARSPMKTSLGSSPRRYSSVAARARSLNPTSSPARDVSLPAVARVLDFDQEGSSLQETPALSGSGQPLGKRRSVYDVPLSPSRGDGAVPEDVSEEEIAAEEVSEVLNGDVEDSYLPVVGGDEEEVPVVDDAQSEAEEERVEEPVGKPLPEPKRRGRKRNSTVAEVDADESEQQLPSRKRVAPGKRALDARTKGRQSAAEAAPARRSKRISDVAGGDRSSILDVVAEAPEDGETPPVAAKRRPGRPPKAQTLAGMTEKPTSAKEKKVASQKEREESEAAVFKKPKVAAKGKKSNTKETQGGEPLEGGKLVDVYRNPLSKADLDRMSTTSGASRFGRGRQLSVFRELEPETVAHVGRTGRHRVKPVDFWRNESVAYDETRSMLAIVKNENQLSPPKKKYGSYKGRGKTRALAAVDEDEEVEMEPWEEEGGTFVGIYREFDPMTELGTSNLLEATIAWSQKGVKPEDVPDATFKFKKLASAGDDDFLNWGFLELLADQMKRSKNARRMHMVFHVQSGAVEVKVHENVFTVHRGGVWQVPRGNAYSIRNVGTATSRIFFAQAYETGLTPFDE